MRESECRVQSDSLSGRKIVSFCSVLFNFCQKVYFLSHITDTDAQCFVRPTDPTARYRRVQRLGNQGQLSWLCILQQHHWLVSVSVSSWLPWRWQVLQRWGNAASLALSHLAHFHVLLRHPIPLKADCFLEIDHCTLSRQRELTELMFVLPSEPDTDECLTGSHDCPPVAACRNTEGSFVCECAQNFTFTGAGCEGKSKKGPLKKTWPEDN